MNRTRIASLVAAALVAGVVSGNVVSGFAAPATAPASGTVASGMGLRLGSAMRDAGGRLSDIVAKLTGMSVEDVQEKREAGASFAEVAATKDVSAEKVVDEALDVRQEVLTARVKDGSITQDQADAALDRMQVRLTDRVTSTDAGCDGAGGGRGGGMGAGRGQGGGRGAGCGGACATQ